MAGKPHAHYLVLGLLDRRSGPGGSHRRHELRAESADG